MISTGKKERKKNLWLWKRKKGRQQRTVKERVKQYGKAVKCLLRTGMSTTCSKMDANRESRTEKSQSERERQIPYDITHMWNLKCGTLEFPPWLSGNESDSNPWGRRCDPWPCWLRIQHCRELWCRSQTRLGSGCGCGVGRRLSSKSAICHHMPPYATGAALRKDK